MKEVVNDAFTKEIKSQQDDNNFFLWNQQLMFDNKCLKSFDYESYLKDDEVLSKALESVKKYGAVLINNVKHILYFLYILYSAMYL